MTSQPLVTVGMVTHNSSRHVAQAVQSVLASSYQQLELVVCDDCSTDETWDIVQEFDDPRLSAFRNKVNLGEYGNRNRALELARGEYLIYIDGDDILYPHGLEHMVRMLHAFPEAAIAMARPWSEKYIYPVVLTPRQVYLSEYLGSGVLGINFAHVLFRTEVLRAVGGLDARYRTGDNYIQLRIALTHSCLLIGDSLAWWRRTTGQASGALLRDHVNTAESVCYGRELLRNPACPLTHAEAERARANLYGGLIRVALRFALRRRVSHAAWLLQAARIPLLAWRYMIVPGRRPYLSDVTADAPLGSDPHRNPFAVTSDCARP